MSAASSTPPTQRHPPTMFSVSSQNLEKLHIPQSEPVAGPSRIFSSDIFGRDAESSIPNSSPLTSSTSRISPAHSFSSHNFKRSARKQSISHSVMSAFSSTKSGSPIQPLRGASSSEPHNIPLTPMRRPSESTSAMFDDLQRFSSGSTSEIHRKSSSKTNFRVVGRGGQGSRPRVAPASGVLGASEADLSKVMVMVKPSTDIRRPPYVPSESGKPNFRVVGRGGSGSKPRITVSTEISTQETPLGQGAAALIPSSTIRVSGRGGAGSRPRLVVNKTTSGADVATKSKAKFKWKGKGKLFSKPGPPSPIFSPQLSNSSTSTISTIQFSGGPRPAPTFFSPKTPSTADGPSIPSTPGFTSFSSTVEDLPLTPVTSIGSMTSDVGNDVWVSDASQSKVYENSMAKLARTLGDLPPEVIYDKLLEERQAKFSALPTLDTDNLPDKARPVKATRRSSIATLGSFSSLVRPSGIILDRVSQHTMSTFTDDVHQFGLSDDLSENWGELQIDSRASYRSDVTSTSPITFAPPKPVFAPTKGLSENQPPLNSSQGQEGAIEDLSLPTPPTPIRSNSYSHSSRKRNDHAHTHTPSEPRPDTPFNIRTLPIKANWINASTLNEVDSIGSVHSSSESTQGWEGEWNRDNLQDVIRSLRALK